jgi:ribosomal protein S18 acetylase RimI-like enzyme
MLYSTLVSSDHELQQILQLQQLYLKGHNDQKEEKEQGFVTLQHSLHTLKQMQDWAPSVIVKENDQVVGYALTMAKECRSLIPALYPLFDMFDQIKYNGQPLAAYRFYVMGQIAVHKAYRGKGLVEMLYHKHRDIYSGRFDFVVTEIAARNNRSLRAHEKIGFITLYRYSDATDDWNIVLWNWK